MFSSISSYLFGSFYKEDPDTLAESPLSEPNIDDWIVIDSKKQESSDGQDGDPSGDTSSDQDLIKEKPGDDLVDPGKENGSLDDASSISSESESSSAESEDEVCSLLALEPAKKVKKPRKPRIIIDDHNGSNAGIMDGSWFVTPPPCFFRQNKSKNRLIPSSPMENMLIEHPSISVYQANTSTDSSINTSPSTPFVCSIEGFDYFPWSPAVSRNLPWPEWKTPTIIKFPVGRLIYQPAQQAQRKSPKKHGGSASQKSRQQNDKTKNKTNPNNNNTNTSNKINIFNMLSQANQPQASRELRAINNNANPHDRHDYLQTINNLQYNLAPMQKAINQGSQKFLTKSFLNRQNLVKSSRGNRQRFTHLY